MRFREVKMRNGMEKERKKWEKVEMENAGFKKWLGCVLGVRVVEGCQDMLMN